MLGFKTITALLTPEPVVTAFFMPSNERSMVGARVYYRYMETRRHLTTEGIVMDVSVHPRGIVWVLIAPDDESKTTRWYIASDVIVSYIW